MKSLINKYIFLTIYWSILLCAVFPVILGLGYIDEFFAFSIFGVMLFYHYYKKKLIPLSIRIYIVFVIFYLVYSVILSVNVTNSVLFDVVQQSKPFVAFWGVFYLYPFFSPTQQFSLRTLSLLVSVIIVVVVIALGMDSSIKFFTGHESGYGGLCMLIAILFYYYSKRTRRDIVIFFILLGLGLISGKSKFYGEFCVALYLFFFCKKKIRVSLKTFLSVAILLLGVIFVTKEKFDLYFVSAAKNEGDGIARVVLYMRSFDVLKDYFPLGAGFGTYGCYASSKFYSPLYYTYGMDTVYGLEPDPQHGNFVADTYYPSIIGEFGLPGCILLIIFWCSIIKRINKNYDEERNMDDYRLSVLLVSVFLIEGIAGPLLLANVGVPIMILLGLITGKSRQSSVVRVNSYYGVRSLKI